MIIGEYYKGIRGLSESEKALLLDPEDDVDVREAIRR